MRQSLPDDVGCKRPSDDNGVGPSNPKMQALADAIINDTLLLDELFGRNGISKVEYEAIKKDLNML